AAAVNPVYQTQTTVNSNCQPLTELHTSWSGSDWEPVQQTIYTYEGERLTEEVTYAWDFGQMRWQEQEKRVHQMVGDTARTTEYAWDAMTNDWETVPSSMYQERVIEGTLRYKENQSASIWSIYIYDAQGRSISNVQKIKDQDGAWVDIYVEEWVYDAKGNLIKETRLQGYNKERDLYESVLILNYTYVEDLLLRQTIRETDQRRWNDFQGRYDLANTTTSTTYDYYCNDMLRNRTSFTNGQTTSRRRIQVDQSLLAACGEGPDHSVMVYPNPAQYVVTIKVDGVSRQPMEIEILDMRGRIVQSKQTEDGLFLTGMDISDLQPGAYIVRVTKAEAQESQLFKFIKSAE
ncbi:MAG: T9SS type A sorting domain-containing protein, partial [Bacteroidota bacterium]